jgi:hypothetical protein
VLQGPIDTIYAKSDDMGVQQAFRLMSQSETCFKFGAGLKSTTARRPFFRLDFLQLRLWKGFTAGSINKILAECYPMDYNPIVDGEVFERSCLKGVLKKEVSTLLK